MFEPWWARCNFGIIENDVRGWASRLQSKSPPWSLCETCQFVSKCCTCQTGQFPLRTLTLYNNRRSNNNVRTPKGVRTRPSVSTMHLVGWSPTAYRSALHMYIPRDHRPTAGWADVSFCLSIQFHAGGIGVLGCLWESIMKLSDPVLHGTNPILVRFAQPFNDRWREKKDGKLLGGAHRRRGQNPSSGATQFVEIGFGRQMLFSSSTPIVSCRCTSANDDTPRGKNCGTFNRPQVFCFSTLTEHQYPRIWSSELDFYGTRHQRSREWHRSHFNVAADRAAPTEVLL